MTHTAANAALVGVTLDPFPDLFSSFLDVTYDESIDELLVSGFPTTYTPDNMTGPQNVLGPNQSFTIDLTVDNAGVASGGSLSVMGNVLSSGPDLLQADLLDFGFIDPPGGEIFDFLFVVSGGDLAADFGGIGATIGVILDINDPGAFDGTFDSDFATTGAAGVSDTGVPEPTSIFLLGVAAGALFLRRRARV
ncbi:MAG TPA: PEP-CTERM sorting domain-containing protein [Phycisphaerae bacterium]|nr:PEP-CTERM sorting domain-containing protein [Phycisphaerae bacterium]HRW51673.1 PEP-CTERM sorting domain-containing protein [Phycisphaerae bacterium]